MKAALAPALATAVLFAALPAFAQSPHRQRHQNPRGDEGRTVYAPQRVCMPLCSMDTSPCDAPEFKHADGRCDYPMIGR
jgi:hypothetical protein